MEKKKADFVPAGNNGAETSKRNKLEPESVIVFFLKYVSIHSVSFSCIPQNFSFSLWFLEAGSLTRGCTRREPVHKWKKKKDKNLFSESWKNGAGSRRSLIRMCCWLRT